MYHRRKAHSRIIACQGICRSTCARESRRPRILAPLALSAVCGPSVALYIYSLVLSKLAKAYPFTVLTVIRRPMTHLRAARWHRRSGASDRRLVGAFPEPIGVPSSRPR